MLTSTKTFENYAQNYFNEKGVAPAKFTVAIYDSQYSTVFADCNNLLDVAALMEEEKRDDSVYKIVVKFWDNSVLETWKRETPATEPLK